MKAERDLRQQVIDDILETIKKSTAKLSDQIRQVVDDAFKVPEPIQSAEGAPDLTPGVPAA
jgi:hypothetical protein